MATIVRKINLVKSDPVNNNNKFWRGTEFDNGDVLCEWGRVGDSGQSKMFPGVGGSFLDKKVREKKTSGRNDEIAYREVDVIDSNVVPVKASTQSSVVSGVKLAEIAKKQIKSSSRSKEVTDLIDFLTKVNVHNITSFCGDQIKYNYDTGLFQTPLGLVSQTTIDGARNVLSDIGDCVSNGDYGNTLLEHTRSYFMMIPQNIGHKKLDINEFWSSFQKVQAQNSLLDGLQASLVQATTPVKDAKSDAKPDKVEEQVFNTELDIVTDSKISKRLFDNYEWAKSTQHSCHNYRPIKVWSVHIEAMRNSYSNYGKKLSNQIEGYHGTGPENILSLLKTGFLVRPPKNAKIAGKMFGPGTYTAPCHIKGSSTKACNYAIGYWGGGSASRTFMFVCDVAMGKFYTPSSSCSGVPSGYDSCWAKGGHKSGVLNDECIVYKESQIDIKYLIELKA